MSLRYTFNEYSGTHLTDYDLRSAGLEKTDFSEMRKRIELYGQIYPSQKTQVIFSLPYLINTEVMNDRAMNAFASAGISDHHHGPNTTDESSSNSETTKGIGDPVVLMNYQVFNCLPETANGYAQRLFAGAGIVIPFGKYKTEISDPLERAHLTGGGSWRLLLNTTYLAKAGKWGMNTNASFLFANTNSEQFAYGSTLNASTVFYYQLHSNVLDIFPSAGVYFEYANRNKFQGKELTSTGGLLNYLHAGCDFYYKRFALSSGMQLPFVQVLYENQPESKYRFITSLAFVL